MGWEGVGVLVALCVAVGGIAFKDRGTWNRVYWATMPIGAGIGFFATGLSFGTLLAKHGLGEETLSIATRVGIWAVAAAAFVTVVDLFTRHKDR